MSGAPDPRGAPRPRPAWHWPTTAIALVGIAYAVLGLGVLSPDAVYSGDIGVKYVQARALAASHFTSLDIPYPGEFLDPAREFFPIRPPFVMTTGGATQAIFSPMSAVIQAIAVSIAGMPGMILVSLAAGVVILVGAWALAGRGLATAPGLSGAAVVLALGLAGPLWFYAVSGWEHAPAVALSTAAFAVAVRSQSIVMPLVAGACLGAGATLRDEVLLLAPGLVLAVWMRRSGFRPMLQVVAGMLVPLAAAAAIEVWWFGRPLAAHLRHAVHLLQTAAHLTDAPNPDVPALRPFSMRERYETVIQYWLLGYGRDAWIMVYGLGLVAALAIRVWFRSSAGLLAWVAAVIGLAALDLHELVTAPKWLAGLHRVSPYLVFALFPRPHGAERRGWYVPVVLVTTVAYVALAFAGADTSGGKSLGPRLLLPLMPLLTAAALGTIAVFLSGRSVVDRWTGRAGVLLVLMSGTMHVFGTVPAYVHRNHDDAAAIAAVAADDSRIVVADDQFTAQLLFPLYYRKIVFLADSPDLGGRLGDLLAVRRMPGAMLVSRDSRPRVGLPPLRLERAEERGRMMLQEWRR
jgi:hypothetical protein